MELPYLAGLFDGEGSMTITKPSYSCPTRHRPIVQIAMTHLDTIQAVQAAAGGRIQRIDQSKYNLNARDRFDWRLSGIKSIEFIQSIRPWLITKADAADIFVQFPFGVQGSRLSQDMLDRREELRLYLREENSRGNNR